MNGTAQIGLVNPKYPHNLGQIVRVAGCYGVDKIHWTGKRMGYRLDELDRLPREERLRHHNHIEWRHLELFITARENRHLTPVCVEVSDKAESLVDFIHPSDALYVFGPEDGSIPRGYKTACQRFVCIPTVNCLNLSVAVATVLYDRAAKTTVQPEQEKP